ncbi:MAG: hypothetical protein JSW45_10970 [Thiotrichales bacterium]|nr:MAG: hypothetical protein JSW45_10970 [Thiotrichales bacterium]
MTVSATETFFLPDEVGREPSSISAEMYNLGRTLLARSEYSCVFVPIRSLQFLGVITENEIVFVDSQAYAYNQDEGGRLIVIAWKFKNACERASLTESIACDVVYYDSESREIQTRLIGDFRDALLLVDHRYRETALPADGAKILKL